MVCAQNRSEREEILDHSSDLRCGRCHSFWIFLLSPLRQSSIATCSSAFQSLSNHQMAELRGYRTRSDDVVLRDLGRRLPEHQPRLEPRTTYSFIEAGSGGVASLARGSLRRLRVISETSIAALILGDRKMSGVVVIRL